MTVATSPRLTDRIAAIAFAPLHWVERARGRKRLALLLLYAIVATTAAIFLWWSQSLRDLPDIGDPFAVIASRAKPVAEADNAFPLYLQAGTRLKALTAAQLSAFGKAGLAPWSAVSPEAREVLAANRDVLLLGKQASDRPGIQLGKIAGSIPLEDYEGIEFARAMFSRLAMLEAARLEDQGDMAGAWAWYAAVMKAHRHLALLSTTDLSFWGIGYAPGVTNRFARWAEDPRVDAALLRQALSEAVAIDASMPSYAASLRGAYGRSINDIEQASASELQRNAGEDQWYKYLPMYAHGLVFLKREPERTRRVLNLVYANLVAHADDPTDQRPRLVNPGVFDVGVDPSGNDPSRRLSPPDLARQIDACLFGDYRLDGNEILFWINREQTARASILIELASQLYEREHGTPPKSPNDLVGPYLDRLPAGMVAPSSP